MPEPILTYEEYVERGVCPFCGYGRIAHASLQADNFQVEKDGLYELMLCRKCGEEWWDRYVLIGYDLKETK